ncbi:MAG: DNA-directed RNA polymerase subunit beta' [Synergistales bacterium]|nr:DNA-directed RNA polymerase subunit beta' [Synergistales bacterium]
MARREIVGVRIKLSSPQRIRELSSGEVKKPETINYRTLRPEKDGLFCERIFGPTRSYECACGKYKRSGPKFKGVVCDRCGVEVTDNRVRRERMGHIELAAPVVHIWYLRGIPSRLSLLIGAATKDLEKVVYFAPNRRREPVYKVVMEGRRKDQVKQGDTLCASEEAIHRHFDPQFKAEEAYRIVHADDVPVKEGDVIGANMVSRYKSEYGDDAFNVEPAFKCLGDAPGGEAAEGDVLSGTEKERLLADYGEAFAVERAHVGNQEGFLVTSAAHLPFAKNDIISASEYQLFHEKYPGRFTAQVEVTTIEDPCYIVVEGGDAPFEKGDIILEMEYRLCALYEKRFRAGIGAEGVEELLQNLDLPELAARLREEIGESTGQKKRKLVKRLNVVEDFRKSDSKPKWMILEALPVIPPDLRPMVQLDGGRFATSDLNDLYRRVINRNNRLRKLQELRAPEIIVRNEKRMLQESVDALVDNGRVGKAVLGAGNRPLKSLSDLLRGKKGRFRQNLLGKRVDYSGRSVIVIGPELHVYQCGLPKQMALELFKPFVMQKLVERGMAPNVKSARRQIERGREEIWAILEEIIKDHPVMLNRAPTLHRLGIQAFEPVLMEGKAIRLHPLVCTAFNADFDGDQMAVHVPLSLEAQAEARILMLSAQNVLSPASGKPIVTPTQDMVLGIYYLTSMFEGRKGEGSRYKSIDDCITALEYDAVDLHARVTLRYDGELLETTPGRALFNSVLPGKIRYINATQNKKTLAELIDSSYDKVGQAGIVQMLDAIKTLGYKWATRSGISLGIGYVIIPPKKQEIVERTLKSEEDYASQYEMGVLTEEEYLRQKETLWSEASRTIAQRIIENMGEENHLRIMVDSGARGSRSQVAQMAGIRGLMADPSGRIIDYPIVANFREGLNMLEYFISTHGARKGLADTALRTAKSGYLTRRLVDVAQDLIVQEEDCGTERGITIEPLYQDGKIVVPINERISGRIALKDIHHPGTGEITLRRNDEITPEMARRIEEIGIDKVEVRSPMTCALKDGICRNCYGRDLASRKKIAKGEAVGVVAAQSIGEPGTQLTMRTFHTGGVRLTGEDITQGLPRIEQLFEVRKPKKVAHISKVDGFVQEIREMEGKRKLILNATDGASRVQYNIPASQTLLVEEGDAVEKGQQLTEGNKDPQEILEVEGLEAAQAYLVNSIQEVYRSQGVSINNKHVEVILRKVAPVNRVRIVEEGDSTFVSNQLVWTGDLDRELEEISDDNRRFLEEGVRSLEGATLMELQGQGNMEALLQYKELPLTADALKRIFMPGTQVKELLVHDEKGILRVVNGEAAFRRNMEGMELLEPYEHEDGTFIDNTGTLTHKQLTGITDHAPQPIVVRDTEILESLKDTTYLADDVTRDGEVLVRGDRKLDDQAVREIREASVDKIKVWKSVERYQIIEDLQRYLLENVYGSDLTQAIDSDGNAVEDIPRKVEATVIRGLMDGTLTAVEVEGEILSREKLLRQVFNEIAYGKVLLQRVINRRGECIAEPGQDVNHNILEMLVKAAPETLVLRPIYAPQETKLLIQRVSFVRRLREEPQWKPLLHGITKAALATDSFLSAASFQQTAQVLAAAAVRGESDPLKGLKENVIIGHLVPAGTGVEEYRKLEVSPAETSVGVQETAELQEEPQETT